MSIYKITNTKTKHYYYGSSFNTLTKRLSEHKRDANCRPECKAHKFFVEIGLDNLKIELVKKCPDAKTERDLKLIENTYIKPVYKSDPLCLNSNLAIREEETKEEYKANWRKKDKEEHPEKYEEKNANERERYWENHEAELARGQAYKEGHREELKQSSKEYYQTVKDKRAKKILCEVCDKYVSSANMKRHIGSQQHQDALKE